MKAHLSSKKNEGATESSKHTKAVAAAAVREVKERAKKAAIDIREQQRANGAPLYILQWGSLKQALAMRELEADQQMFSTQDLSVPCIAHDKDGSIKAMSENKIVQYTLCSYAGSYKRDATTTEDGRTQSPVIQGKAAFDDIWKAVLTCFPPGLAREAKDLPSPLDKVTAALWNFGYLPDMKVTAPTPNALAMVKILLNGHVDVLAIDAKALLPAMRVLLATDTVKFKDVVAKLETADEKTFDAMLSNGCAVFHGTLAPMSILYVPAGFIVCEKVMKGILVHGVRRSFVIRSGNQVRSIHDLMLT